MRIHRILADMALELEQQRTPDDMLRTVCAYALTVLDADDAGILLTRSRREIETPHATSARVAEAHQLQAAFDEGPCLDAIEGRATYVSGDVARDERWPQWGPAAAALGINSVVGVRLASRDRGYGSLNIYASRLGAFSREDAELAEMLAAHATAAYAAIHRLDGAMAALDTRSVIGQAQGILMQKFDIDADSAFNFLRRISQHENIRLVAVAEAISVQRDSNARPAPTGADAPSSADLSDSAAE